MIPQTPSCDVPDFLHSIRYNGILLEAHCGISWKNKGGKVCIEQ